MVEASNGSIEEIRQYLESAYRSGIHLVKALIERKLSLPKWEKNNVERATKLRLERLRLLEELQKKGHLLK